ncbi:MAG: DUF3105 domain-containing protein [Actinomycetota bacterium]|nr:DUF3105 domain-containing protein [Actinomycetota bacterium]
MADDSPSKRERQKQRREAKLREQRAQAAKARRNRLLAFVALGVVVAGLVGAAIANQVRQRQEVAQRRAAAEARLDEVGCTPDTEQPSAGQGHLGGQDLATQPPDVLYPDRPASSGMHFGNWLKTGVYDVRIDERILVHNLEHGYVLAYYDEDASDEDVEALKSYAETQIDGKFPKLVVAPWDEQLPDDANVAYVAWNFRQLCEQFDEEILDVFLTAHHSGAGIAPEKTIAPHLEAGNGTLDPEGKDLLLPPLGTPPPQATEGASEGASDTPTATTEQSSEATGPPSEAATEAPTE